MKSSRHCAAVLLLIVLFGTSNAAFLDSSVFQTNPTINKNLCASCFFQWQCQSGRCHKRKCVSSFNKAGILPCFQPECAPCTTRMTCRSNRCFGEPGNTKCVKYKLGSVRNCFPEVFATLEPNNVISIASLEPIDASSEPVGTA